MASKDAFPNARHRQRRADGFDRLYLVCFDGAGGFDVRPMDEEN